MSRFLFVTLQLSFVKISFIFSYVLYEKNIYYLKKKHIRVYFFFIYLVLGRYSQAPEYSATCQTLGNMIQPDPNNCAYYHLCEYFDKAPIRKPCPGNTLYDPRIRTCNALTNVICYHDLRCPRDQSGLYPHPLDCNKFINCDDYLVPHVQMCPEDQVFDSIYKTCNNTMGMCIVYI